MKRAICFECLLDVLLKGVLGSGGRLQRSTRMWLHLSAANGKLRGPAELENLLGPRKYGSLSWDCCLCSLNVDKWQKIDGWMDGQSTQPWYWYLCSIPVSVPLHQISGKAWCNLVEEVKQNRFQKLTQMWVGYKRNAWGMVRAVPLTERLMNEAGGSRCPEAAACTVIWLRYLTSCFARQPWQVILFTRATTYQGKLVFQCRRQSPSSVQQSILISVLR